MPKTHEEAIAHLQTVHFLELEGVDITTLGGIISAMKLFASTNTQVALATGIDHKRTLMAIAVLLSDLNDTATDSLRTTTEALKKSMIEAIAEMKDGLHTTIREEMAKMNEETMGMNNATLEKVKETAAETKIHIEKVTNEWTTIQRKVPRSSSTQNSSTQPRWSDIVASGAIAGANSRVAAKAAIAARQVKVRIEGDSGALRVEMDNKETKAAAQAVLVKMGCEHQIRSASKSIKDKSILFEMWTDDGAEWLRQNVVVEELTKAWGIRYTPRKFALVAKFVPVECDLDKERDNILEENNIEPSSVHEIKWMKAVGRRTKTQVVANVLVTVTNEAAANDLVARGLYVHSQFRKVEKMKHEPIRCNKCQLYGHMARECKQQGETCAYCGESHRSSTCTNAKKKHCRPCGTAGHTATDRMCPTFQKKCQDFNGRNPDNALPFFPTNDPWTWTLGDVMQTQPPIPPLTSLDWGAPADGAPLIPGPLAEPIASGPQVANQ